MQKILWKIRYFEIELTFKSFLKVNFIILFNPIPFNGQNYQKQKGPGTSGQTFLKLRNKVRKIPLLVTYYYLTTFDDVI